MTDNIAINAQITLNIDYIGAMGDGVGRYKGQVIFVPLTCAGDQIKAVIDKISKDNVRAKLVEIITPSADRQPARCRHFGQCGGCNLQHLNPPVYQQFKQDILTKSGIDAATISPLINVGEKSRRRSEFKISVNKNEVKIGFYAAKSHDIIEIEECPISHDDLIDILPEFKKCLESLKKTGSIKTVSLSRLEVGLDMVITINKPLKAADTEKIIQFAAQHNIVRLSQNLQSNDAASTPPIQILYDNGDAYIDFAGTSVYLPVGAFLQATQAGQDAITQLVLDNLQDSQIIADLYAGCGTYSFPLSQQSQRISAFEGAQYMVSAMHNAIMGGDLAGKISTSTRDLSLNPLSTNELSHFDGVVINPPRNGALSQIKQLAKSKVSTIVMVSCNPATFKRDRQYLLDAGYNCVNLTPIDQFYWSKHLELVAIFKK